MTVLLQLQIKESSNDRRFISKTFFFLLNMRTNKSTSLPNKPIICLYKRCGSISPYISVKQKKINLLTQIRLSNKLDIKASLQWYAGIYLYVIHSETWVSVQFTYKYMTFGIFKNN